MAKEVTAEQLQIWTHLSDKIAVAKEHLNALCAEAHQSGLRVSMNVHRYNGQRIGDAVHREYIVLAVDVTLSLTHATDCQ